MRVLVFETKKKNKKPVAGLEDSAVLEHAFNTHRDGGSIYGIKPDKTKPQKQPSVFVFLFKYKGTILSSLFSQP